MHLLRKLILILLVLLFSSPAFAENWCANSANKGCFLMEDTGNETDRSEVVSNDLTETSGTIPRSSDRQFGDFSRDFERGDNENLSQADGLDTDISGANQNLSIVTWIKWENDNGSSESIIGKMDNILNQQQFNIFISGTGDNEYRQEISNDGSTLVACEGGTLLSPGVWYHIASVYNDTDIRLYLDGVLDSNGADNPKAYTAGIFNGSARFAVGSQYDNGGIVIPFDGLIDDVGIFDDAKDATDINDIMDNGLVQVAAVTNGVTFF